MRRNYYVYIITNFINTTLYVGISNNLERRVWEHINEVNNSFSKKYKIKKLIYYELFGSPDDAIRREKQLKRWHRDWKLNLIKESNPTLKDLYSEWKDAETSSA